MLQYLNSAAAETARTVYTVRHWRRHDRWRIRESVIVCVVIFVRKAGEVTAG
jgi:hypothetical protein